MDTVTLREMSINNSEVVWQAGKGTPAGWFVRNLEMVNLTWNTVEPLQ